MTRSSAQSWVPPGTGVDGTALEVDGPKDYGIDSGRVRQRPSGAPKDRALGEVPSPSTICLSCLWYASGHISGIEQERTYSPGLHLAPNGTNGHPYIAKIVVDSMGGITTELHVFQHALAQGRHRWAYGLHPTFRTSNSKIVYFST